MKTVMVQYEVKPDHVGENVRFVRAVFAQLERDRPEGIRYVTFEHGEGAFVHIGVIETPDGKNPLLALAAFQEFSARIKERTVAPPRTTELTLVGAYRVFG